MELHELKTRLQQHLTDGLVLVVGSGLSCAEGLPSMGGLAQHLRTTLDVGNEQADISEWEAISKLIDSEGLEAALLKKAPSARLAGLIVQEVGSFIADKERLAILDVFNGSKILRLTRLIPHLVRPKSGLPIVTTNYDRLVEIAVEEAGLGVDTMFFGRFAGRLNEKESKFSFCRGATLKGKSVALEHHPRALVFKPHGSLDWYLRKETPVHYVGDLPGAIRLIITPGQGKFRDGYESPFDKHRARANDAIDKAARFLIIGYGFNDDHLETHLVPAIKSGKPSVFMTFELSGKAVDLAKNNPGVIAMDNLTRDGSNGTRAIVDKHELFFPGVSIWDVDNFVSEVLKS